MPEMPQQNGSPGNSGRLLVNPRIHGQLQPLAPTSGSMNVWMLLRALRRRLFPALVVGILLGVIIGTTAWFVIPPAKKTVRSLLFMSAAQPHVLYKSGETQHHQFELYQRSQVAILKSHFVLNIAMDTPEVRDLKILKEQPEPVQWLEKELRADFSAGPEVLRISMEGDDGKALQAIVNAVTKAYLDEIVNKERKKKLDRHDTLKGWLSKYEDKVTNKRELLKQLANAAGSNKSEVLILKQQFAVSQLSAAKMEHAKLLSELRKVGAKLEIAEEQFRPKYRPSLLRYGCPAPGLPMNLALASVLEQRNRRAAANIQVPESVLEEWFKQDVVIKKYAKRLGDLEAWIEAFKRVSSPSKDKKVPAPLLLTRQAELEAARQSIQERRQALRPRAIEEIQLKGRLLGQATIGQLRQEKASLQRWEKMLKDDIDQLVKDSKDLNDSNLRVDDLNNDIKRWETTCEHIAREIDNLEVERLAPDRVTELEKAVIYTPDHIVRQALMATTAGLGSLALVLFVFAWFELRCRRVDSPDDVVRDLGISLMGTLPDFNRTRFRWTSSRDAEVYWENHLINSVDAVRTTILFAAREENLKAVLVTSAVSGEGKTSSASHLAASLTRAGRRTLLVDCDLRNPSAHRLLDVSRAPGFSELLRGENSLAEVIRPTNVDGLSVITAGQGDLIAIQALAQDRLGSIFQALREQFDFIVIDSSPILPVPDALLIAQHADGVIFSVLREVSRIPKIVAAYHRLAFLQVRILGAVVSGARDEGYGTSHYGYGYGASASSNGAESAASETAADEAK